MYKCLYICKKAHLKDYTTMQLCIYHIFEAEKFHLCEKNKQFMVKQTANFTETISNSIVTPLIQVEGKLDILICIRDQRKIK